MININLLPWREEIEQKKIKIFLGQGFIALFVSFVVCMVFYMKASEAVADQKQEISNLESKMVKEDAKLDDAFVKMISSEKGNTQLDFLERKEKENQLLVNVLFFLGKALSQAIFLKKCEKKEGVIYVYGSAIAQEDVLSLSKEMGENFPDETIHIEEESWVEGNAYPIDFIIKIASKMQS